MSLRVSEFDFSLPPELIAQAPPAERGGSRMLVVKRADAVVKDDFFAHIVDLLSRGDVLILNDSRVLPSRLYAIRAGLTTQKNSPDPTGRIEVLLTKQAGQNLWSALVRPSRKVVAGERLLFHDAAGEVVLEAEVLEAGEFGERTLKFQNRPDFLSRLEAIGHMPLPPYIHRDDTAMDRERYQTVYAQSSGSAAAPTAGLHFTPAILDLLRAKGVEIHTVTLHVGLGTFQPVRVETLDEIELHTEFYTLPQSTADAVNKALGEGRRIIAAGTTTTRTLEHCAAVGRLEGHSGSTNIFIRPGFEFKVVSGLLTNFHLPKSTLLMLVSAFMGREEALSAYGHAVREGYRFFSYGDCMLIL